MIYIIVIIVLTAEMAPYPIYFGAFTLLSILLYITVSWYLFMMIFLQFDKTKGLVFWLTLVFLLIISIVDFFFLTQHE